MKPLLTISAAVESATGLALLVAPSVPASLLLGSTLETAVGSTIARIAGAGLLALGIACWLGRNDAVGARALVAAMLFYISASVWFVYHRYRMVNRSKLYTMPWPRPKGY